MDGTSVPTATHINLLGPFSIETPAGPAPRLSIAAPRQRAMIAFVAMSGGRVGREQLASLFWGEQPDRRSRQNLRQLLLEVRRAGALFIAADAQSVWFDRATVSIDVDRFLALARSASPNDWARAALLYCGDLLEGITIDIDSFDEWLRPERDRLRQKAETLFEQLARAYAADGRLADALELAERLVALDPDNEAPRRLVIHLLAAHRGADSAILYARRFIAHLSNEFGAEPEPETVRLLSDIRARASGPNIAISPDARAFLESPAAQEGERKIVTILFARLHAPLEFLAAHDLEDTTSLVDPVLSLMMEAVRYYDGTVSQLLSDGMMAIFGAPVAHEDHAMRACQAALRIRGSLRVRAAGTSVAMPRIRMGIHSGEAVVRAIATAFRVDYGALGQTPQLAERVVDLAVADEILLTKTTIDLAQCQLVLEARGLAPISELPGPVGLSALHGIDGVQPLFDISDRELTPFIGRRDEIARFNTALIDARRGKGQVAALFGDPGVGKSRLCREFIRSSRTKSWRILRCRAVSYGQATPLAAVIDLLRGLFGISGEQDAGVLREQVRDRIIAAGNDLAHLVPAILSVLDLPVDDPAWAELAPAARRLQTLDGVTRLLIRISQTVPLLILIEDLHWIDSETSVFLDGFVDRISDERVFMLANYRPEFKHAWSGKPHYHAMPIEPLPPVRATALLNALLGENPGAATLKPALIARTEGNPMFLEESIRMLVEAGTLEGTRGAYRLGRASPPGGYTGGLGIPPTIQGILAGRIDRLRPQDKRLLQSAAVIGREVALAPLQAISGPRDAIMSDGAITEALRRLQNAEFLHKAASAEPRFIFKHALTYDVAYGSMLLDRRRDLHARLVAVIERLYADRLDEHVDELARHAERAELWASAVHYLRRAAAKHLGRSSYREAKLSLDRALLALARLPEATDHSEQALAIRMDLRLALLPLGDQVGLEQNLIEARAIATDLGDHESLGRIVNFLSSVHNSRGENEQGLALGSDAARMSGDAGTRCLGIFLMGTHNQALGRYGASLPWFREAIATVTGSLVHERFDQVVLPSVVSRAGLAISLAEMGQFDEALAIGKETLHIAEAPGSRAADLVVALMCLGRPYLRRGDVATAGRLYERAMRICREVGLAHYLVAVAPALGATYVLNGRAESAIELLEPVKELHEKMSMFTVYAFTVSVLSEAVFVAGDEQRANDLARHGLAFSRDRHHRGWEAWTLRLMGEIAARRSSPDLVEAAQWYEQGLALAVQCEMRPLAAQCHAVLGLLYRRLRDPVRADEHRATGRLMQRAMRLRPGLSGPRSGRIN